MSRINVGEKMIEMPITTAYKGDTTIHSLLKGKTIFWVLRYIGCTVCRYDVHMINERYQEFVDKGAQVYVVMQSDVEHIHRDLEGVDMKLDIICDPEMKFYNALEILPATSKEEMIGDMDKLMAKGGAARELGFTHGDYEGDEMQLPAMFVVEEDGIVSYVRYGQNITDLPTVDEVLTEIL